MESAGVAEISQQPFIGLMKIAETINQKAAVAKENLDPRHQEHNALIEVKVGEVCASIVNGVPSKSDWHDECMKRAPLISSNNTPGTSWKIKAAFRKEWLHAPLSPHE